VVTLDLVALALADILDLAESLDTQAVACLDTVDILEVVLVDIAVTQARLVQADFLASQEFLAQMEATGQAEFLDTLAHLALAVTQEQMAQAE
jgi:hypothetical protein